ncbi:hemin-degrading factor [Fertoebacter nigrum]|uniref:Hemin-degrading factor n=1 Tax=Fertoeibacter niger TaxID=2656921 RepID=A0A8X8KQN8_9RHOB|nr:ChuX/HutX family heme-like substrate-binding protein [Fertoeibacter niger]NUB46176.1 hemin-degrading factor [Fertoeibacter niger]
MAADLVPAPLSPAKIRLLRAENPKPRARDFAALHGISEAALVAAFVGHGTTRIDATVDLLFPLIGTLGDVMALTRNSSCVHERRGSYTPFHGGAHAAMVTGDEIDMRMFPAHWVHGFAVEENSPEGAKRSLQIFDAHGDAVHKVHLKPESDHLAFITLVETLRVAEQSDTVATTPRAAPEGPRADPARADDLRAEWGQMTDTHQFLKLVRRLKMNRLGANRVVGSPFALPLETGAVTAALHAAADGKVPVMIFVGNQGCIQIHGGPIEKVVPMGPWINVMDPRFNLHLRADHIAEVWLVTKPTQRGDAVSVEAFDADGELIVQIFGYRKNTGPEAWQALTATLPRLAVEVMA